MLRSQASRSYTMQRDSGREYQFITGGDDGMVFWWNCRAPYITDLKAIEPVDWRQPNRMLTLASSYKIESLQAIHDIHLTESAQIYSLILGFNTLTIGDSQGILTFYNTSYIGLDDDIVLGEDVDPLIDQVNDEGMKDVPNSKQPKANNTSKISNKSTNASAAASTAN